MRKIRTILQLIINVGIGIFCGLLWSQQFQLRHVETTHESANELSRRAIRLTRSFDSMQEQVHKLQSDQQLQSKSVSADETDVATTMHIQDFDHTHHTHDHNSSIAIVLQHQVNLQAEFQDLLRKRQFPLDCSHERILLTFDTEKPADGFARELQDMNRLLQVAVATKRTLVVREGWKSAYQPPSCMLNTSWTCLWQPLSSCSSSSIGGGPEFQNANQSSSLAIDTSLDNTPYFDTYLYGPTRVLSGRKWPWGRYAFSDVIPHWERVMGRFWIRAQTAHFLWQPNDWLREQVELRLLQPPPEGPHQHHQRYIGMHIRFTDNRQALAREFGRDATVTRNFRTFMDHAAQIRLQHNVSVIYLSTDNDQMIEQTKRRIYRKKWTFLIQDEVQRGTSKRHLWFEEGRNVAAVAIATDLEVLRRADFLIGSHQSNVYRLACQLNSAYHTGRYPLAMDRHRSVDVEWFEDP